MKEQKLNELIERREFLLNFTGAIFDFLDSTRKIENDYKEEIRELLWNEFHFLHQSAETLLSEILKIKKDFDIKK